MHNHPDRAKDFGVVGTVCINIDAKYLTEEVIKSQERIESWFKNFCRVDMVFGRKHPQQRRIRQRAEREAPFKARVSEAMSERVY
jgi:hypothetical protein